ncbi:hypothetical protein FQN54_007613 [Arachnomyces sp. PD_36]|nr:hypothetical protein FQN54_007613 [Arachnomyces sp. PD_36]
MPLIPESVFRDRLQAAIVQPPRTYTSAYTLLTRFESDDSQAIQDSEGFKTICNAFGLPAPVEVVVTPADPMPSWTIAREFQKILIAAAEAPGRSLVMVHYAGHGSLNQFNRLTLHANGNEPRSVGFDVAFSNNIDESSDFSELDPDVDVVMLIDSCYSGSAFNRAIFNMPRVVEILAACEPDKITLAANPRNQNQTFTAKLADIVVKQKRKGKPLSFVEMMALVDRDSAQIKPFYELFSGRSSVKLCFPGECLASAPTAQMSVAYHIAVFSVCLEPLMEERVELLANWIKGLDRTFNIIIKAVYNAVAKYVGLIIEAPYHIYAQLRRLPGIDLIF